MSGPAPRAGLALERASLIVVTALMVLALFAAAAPWLVPGENATAQRAAAAGIFAASYLALAIGKVPGLSIDRAGVALVGACLMVASGALPLADAYRAIDFNTITLLLGMMIVVANLRLSGFFVLITHRVARRAHKPLMLLAAVTVVSGVFSAFLVNDTICLVMAPLVVELTLALGRRPLPYLLAVAMASNVGSTATVTGNPQNMMIANFSHVAYADFAAALAPVAALGLVLTIGLIAVLYRAEFRNQSLGVARMPRLRVNRPLMLRSLVSVAVVIALFFAGQPPPKVAVVVGALLLLTRRVKSARVYAELDWSLLLMFAGLFIIVAGAERQLLSPEIVSNVVRLHLSSVPVLSVVTAALSNLVSNVPAVLMLRPFVDALSDQATAWKVIAMASTLAGNFTILGSVANLIVVEKAAQRGVVIGFRDHFIAGGPLTVLTIVLGAIWLEWR